MKARRMFRQKWRGHRITVLMARDGLNCTICGLPLSRKVKDECHPEYITFDHIVPRSLGGSDDLSNIRLAHQFCNNTRGNDPILPEQEGAAAT